MATKKLWDMTKVLAWAFNLVVGDVQAKFRPCVKPNTKVLATKDCEWCGAKGKLFVFVSEDNQHFLGVCKACRKHEVRPAKGEPHPPYHAQCVCGQDLPDGRKKFCYDCRPLKKKPTVVDNGDGSASIKGEMVGYGM